LEVLKLKNEGTITYYFFAFFFRFKISLEATQPNEDDLIILSAPLGERDSVSFKLINRFKDFATFRSHFTEGSDSEFSVTPMTGLLEPAGGKNST